MLNAFHLTIAIGSTKVIKNVHIEWVDPRCGLDRRGDQFYGKNLLLPL